MAQSVSVIAVVFLKYFIVSSLLNFSALSANNNTSFDYTFIGQSPKYEGRNEKGSLYYISNTESNWSDAWLNCQVALQGQLLSIENDMENSLIRELMIKQDKNVVWTAGAFSTDEGIWKWASTGQVIDNKNQDFVNSNATTPNKGLRVGILNSKSSKSWVAEPSEKKMHSVCEVAAAVTVSSDEAPITRAIPTRKPSQCPTTTPTTTTTLSTTTGTGTPPTTTTPPPDPDPSPACVMSAPGAPTQGGKWRNGRIPYQIKGTIPPGSSSELSKAVTEIQSKTCVRLIPKVISDVSWVTVEISEDDCGVVSTVDCCHWDERPVVIGARCLQAGDFIHAFGHSLCLSHETERPDRDEYIEFSEDCDPDPIYDWRDPAIMDIFYDYVSFMHDDSYCYNPTISGVTHFGSGGMLSVLDAEKINAYYNCGGCFSYRYRPAAKVTGSDNLVPVSRDEDGKQLFVCRAWYNGDIVPGRGTRQACSFAYDGRERVIIDAFGYELLTNPQRANLVWITAPADGTIPSQAIPGGRTASREPLYIGRCVVQINGQDMLLAGKIHKSAFANGAFVSYNEKEYQCTNNQILVCQ